jgi:hypothetical protein
VPQETEANSVVSFYGIAWQVSNSVIVHINNATSNKIVGNVSNGVIYVSIYSGYQNSCYVIDVA